MPEALRASYTLLPMGIVIGCLGSLAGVGGGFLIVPLLLLWGTWMVGTVFTPEMASGTSLSVVFLTALSAVSVAGWKRRIDYRVGAAFALMSVPGALGGRWLVRMIPPGSYGIVFALLLAGIAVYLAVSRSRDGEPLLRGTPREHREGSGEAHRYEVHFALGLAVSFLLGFVASLMGVGGGIVLVPLMTLVFGMPVHLATATSQFVLCVTALIGAGEAAVRGQIAFPVLLWMGAGAIVGAQAGVRLSKALPGRVVRLILAVILMAGAVSLVLQAI